MNFNVLLSRYPQIEVCSTQLWSTCNCASFILLNEQFLVHLEMSVFLCVCFEFLISLLIFDIYLPSPELLFLQQAIYDSYIRLLILSPTPIFKNLKCNYFIPFILQNKSFSNLVILIFSYDNAISQHHSIMFIHGQYIIMII